MNNPKQPEDTNPDPITGAPGAHPVGVGVGAASAGAAGAIIGGIVGGPVGAAIGAAVGTVTGGMAGKGVAESVNPTVEDAYWRENFSRRPYVKSGTNYDEMRPAYQHGWESRGRYAGTGFVDAEPHLRRDWEGGPNASRMEWNKARDAVRDAWDRAAGAGPGDYGR
jgi:hypothetical protein